MAVRLKRILPGKFELVALLVVAIGVLLLGNSQALLHSYGLDPSTQVVQQSTKHVIGNGLTILDGFSFTDRVVTFLIWSLVGILCFSIVRSVGMAYDGLREERALSSRRYIHPSTFTKRAFWRQVLLDFLLLLASLSLTAIAVYGFFAAILPVGLKYGHALLFNVSLAAIGGFILAAGLIYTWLLLLDICLRLITQRHQLAT